METAVAEDTTIKRSHSKVTESVVDEGSFANSPQEIKLLLLGIQVRLVTVTEQHSMDGGRLDSTR